MLIWPVSGESFFLVAEACFPSVSSHSGASRPKARSHVSSYKDTNPIHEGSTLMTMLPAKGPTSEHHHIGGGGGERILRGHKHSIHNKPIQDL